MKTKKCSKKPFYQINRIANLADELNLKKADEFIETETKIETEKPEKVINKEYWDKTTGYNRTQGLLWVLIPLIMVSVFASVVIIPIIFSRHLETESVSEKIEKQRNSN